MNIDKRSRAELKAYFVKNSVPTESNFADLIDAALYQKDDGVFKPTDGPLCLEAAGNAKSRKEVLKLFNDFGDSNPEWVLSLNPRKKVSDPASAKAGFNLADGAGKNRLFMSRADGRVGVGTLEPSATVHIATGSDAGLQSGGYLVLGPVERTNLVLDDNEIQARNKQSVSTLNLQADGGEVWIHNNQPVAQRVRVTLDGKVGIGLTSPQAPLHVVGGGDAGLSRGGALVLGSVTKENLVFDVNEILARNNKKASPLYIQTNGGEVHFHHQSSPQNNFRFLEDGKFFGAARGEKNKLLRIATGQTTAGAGWVDYSKEGIKLVVDTSAADFDRTPMYFTSVHGTSGHWKVTGTTSIYEAKKDRFTVYLYAPRLRKAAAAKWYVTWMAVGA